MKTIKKRALLLITLLITNIFLITIISSQDIPQLPLDINPETGLPDSFSKFQEVGEQLSEEEQRKEYLSQEWTKLLAKNKILGPILFYTNKGFGFFNPLWKIIFGIEFSLSWAFIFSLIIWVFFIILIYNPIKGFTSISSVVSLIISLVLSSALSFFAMQKIINLITPLISNIWIVLISIIILIILAGAYIQLFKGIKEKREKSEEKWNREKLKQDVKIAEGFTKGVSEGLR